VGLWVTKQFRELGDILYIGQVADLYALEKRDGWIEIGAAVSLEQAYEFLAEDYPELTELWKRFASLPIRNAGTLGGNIANGSPIGDSAPALIAIGTRVVLQRGEVRRELPLEDLYLAYQKNAMEDGEFVAGLRIPVREGRDAMRFRTYKLSKRFDEDISAVCAALAIELDGNIVRSARIAYGGMAATSKRATETEAAITGQPWNETTVRAAMAAMSRDYTPLTDMRATDNYRRISAANTVYRFWLETRTDAPLTPEQINVRAVELNTLTAA
jgi:xanthine dehydrogenase small subunit